MKSLTLENLDEAATEDLLTAASELMREAIAKLEQQPPASNTPILRYYKVAIQMLKEFEQMREAVFQFATEAKNHPDNALQEVEQLELIEIEEACREQAINLIRWAASD